MPLEVVRDRPSVRRAYGINAPMFVSLAGGERTRAHEWSHLGLVVDADAVPPTLRSGGTVHTALHLNFQGYDIQVPARAKMDMTGEVDPGDGLVRLEFVDLSPRSAGLIEHFVEDFVRGRMVPAQDTLVRIDAPPEPISTKPDKPPDDGAAGRSLKPYIMSAFYLALGLAVIGYLGVLFYVHALRMEVTSAVVTRPLELVRTSQDAVVAEVFREPGDRVEAGDLIARLYDPELDERIARARAVVETASDALTRARRRLRIDEQRVRDFSRLDNQQRRYAQRDAREARKAWWRSVEKVREVVSLRDERPPKGVQNESCEARLKPAERADLWLIRTMLPTTDPIKSYLRKREVPCFVLTDLYRDQLRLRRIYDDAVKVVSERQRIDELGDRRVFNGREFIVDLDVATLERDKAKARQREAQAMLASLIDNRDRADVRASRNGRITVVRAAPRLSVVRGETLAIVEANVSPTIEAYLDQDEVSRVRLGDKADVFIPALDRGFAATVATVDRTAGFIDEQNAVHRWRAPKDRSALVTLTVAGEDLGSIGSGMPATVLFHRRRPLFAAKQAVRDLVGARDDAAASNVETLDRSAPDPVESALGSASDASSLTTGSVTVDNILQVGP